MLRFVKMYWPPVIIGVFAFLTVNGFKTLNPANLAWLVGWDPSQEYFGWAIFKNGPWTFPIGLNPNYGLEISSSIVYSDSIPVLALIFKLFAGVLPTDFQYFGIWNLTCFIFQAIFAWKLISLVTQDKWTIFFAVGLFVFSPILFWKIPTNSSLVSQFLVIWAIFLSLNETKKNINVGWIVLLAISECIFFYIFAMIFILWLASLIDRLIQSKSVEIKYLWIEFFIAIIVIFFVGWQVGYFAVNAQSAATGNYGLGAVNFLAPIDSNGWSYVLKDIPQTPFNLVQSNVILNRIEGFNYLGLGVIFALIIGCFGLCLKEVKPYPDRKESLLRSKPFFWAALIILWIIALSNQISIGPYNFSFSLPAAITKFLSMFRASGRMFWPVYYVMVFLGIYLIIRRFSQKTSLLLICFCFFIQVADTSAGWLPLRHNIENASVKPIEFPLTSNFWAVAAKKYNKVVHVPVKNNMYEWRVFARYAAQNKLSTNSVFLSRVDEAKLIQANILYKNVINTGEYDKSTLYIIDSGLVFSVLSKLNNAHDLFAQVDGFNVIAPGWKSCNSCLETISDVQVIKKDLSSFKFGTRLLFSSQDDPKNRYLLSSGWGNPEPWGTWSNGNESELIFPPSIDRYKKISIEMRALISDKLHEQVVGIEVNGENFGNRILTSGEKNSITIVLSDDYNQKDNLSIKFRLPNAARPIDLGIAKDDERVLAVGLISLVIN